MFSLFSKGKANSSEGEDTNKNIGKITTDKAVEIIKGLSGGEVRHTKRLIDNVIVMTGASGGTGVSTVLSNIAHMASKKGLRVLVIDLNIMYPVQHLYFGSDKAELEKPDLVGYLLGKCTIGEAIENNGKVSLVYSNNRTIVDSINCEADTAVSNFTEAISRLKQLFDLVLIDCPLRIDHVLCNMAFYIADSIYVVWDEGISSISNTERIRRNMAVSGIDSYIKMRAILNKRTNIQYSSYPFEKLNMELVEVLPFDTDIIYSTLRSEVFCDKGASKSKNANIFYSSIESLTGKILERGGYIE